MAYNDNKWQVSTMTNCHMIQQAQCNQFSCLLVIRAELQCEAGRERFLFTPTPTTLLYSLNRTHASLFPCLASQQVDCDLNIRVSAMYSQSNHLKTKVLVCALQHTLYYTTPSCVNIRQERRQDTVSVSAHGNPARSRSTRFRNNDHLM